MVKYLNQICTQGKVCSKPKAIRSNNCKEEYYFFIEVKKLDSDEVDKLKIICSSEVYEKYEIIEDELYRIEGKITRYNIVATTIVKIPIEFKESQWEKNYNTLNKSLVRGVVINKYISKMQTLDKKHFIFKISINNENIICEVPEESEKDLINKINIGNIVNFEGRLESDVSKISKYHVSVIKYYLIEM